MAKNNMQLWGAIGGLVAFSGALLMMNSGAAPGAADSTEGMDDEDEVGGRAARWRRRQRKKRKRKGRMRKSRPRGRGRRGGRRGGQRGPGRRGPGRGMKRIGKRGRGPSGRGPSLKERRETREDKWDEREGFRERRRERFEDDE